MVEKDFPSQKTVQSFNMISHSCQANPFQPLTRTQHKRGKGLCEKRRGTSTLMIHKSCGLTENRERRRAEHIEINTTCVSTTLVPELVNSSSENSSANTGGPLREPCRAVPSSCDSSISGGATANCDDVFAPWPSSSPRSGRFASSGMVSMLLSGVLLLDEPNVLG